MCVYCHMDEGAHGGQMGTSDPLEPELKAAVSCLMWTWVLESKLRSPEEQQALLTTEPARQPLKRVLVWYACFSKKIV